MEVIVASQESDLQNDHGWHYSQLPLPAYLLFFAMFCVCIHINLHFKLMLLPPPAVFDGDFCSTLFVSLFVLAWHLYKSWTDLHEPLQKQKLLTFHVYVRHTWNWFTKRHETLWKVGKWILFTPTGHRRAWQWVLLTFGEYPTSGSHIFWWLGSVDGGMHCILCALV